MSNLTQNKRISQINNGYLKQAMTGKAPVVKVQDRYTPQLLRSSRSGRGAAAVQSFHRTLDNYAKRASCLYPDEAKDFGEFFEGIKHSMEDEGLKKKSAELVMAARGDSPEASAQAKHMLAKIRLKTTENFIRASSNYVAFFDREDLEDDEQPWMQSMVPQEVKVECIGQDGPPRAVGPVKRQGQAPVDLCMLSTDRYEYDLLDVYQGRSVRNDQLALVDLEYDLSIQVDVLLKQFILKGTPNSRVKATFTTTGAEQDRDYYASRHVDTANFPVGNDLTPSSNDASSWLRQENLDDVIEYCQSWGGALELRPEAIYIPSSHSHGWLKQVTLIAEGANSKVEEIFAGGAIMSYGSYTWQLIADNTLSPDAGVSYVRTNQPIGTVFFKPSLSQYEVVTEKHRNREYQWRSLVFGAGFSSAQTPNLIAVQYRDAV